LTEAFRMTSEGLEIRLRVQPNASKDEFSGLQGDRLKLRVRAKPVEGEANEAVRRFLAKVAGVAKSQVEFLRGETSREKDIRIRPKVSEGLEALKQAALQIRQAAGLD